MERIQDHALIGDCRSAALVSTGGTIDWLCWPRFDSPSIFGALLDDGAGRWTLAPTRARRATRRYLDGTNVLETSFESASGTLVVTDFMPAASDDEKRRLMLADHELVRIARCDDGEVELEWVLEVRPRYASAPVRARDAGKLGVRIEANGGLVVLRTDSPNVSVDGALVRGRHRLRSGDQVHFSLTFADEWPAILPPVGEWTRMALDRTIAWWRRWVAQLRYDGPARNAVVRSALALRLMVYAPSGAVVAAPTTSLPERVGGDFNWDYRFCWLRDASMTLRALFGLGYPDEAEAFLSWLLHSTRITRPELRVLYDVFGNRPGVERIIEHFSGYFGSRPVRIGNAATEQLQADGDAGRWQWSLVSISQRGFSRRGRVRNLQLLGRRICRDRWRPGPDGRAAVRAAPQLRERRRALRRRGRPCDGRGRRKLPASIHARRADQCGAVDHAAAAGPKVALARGGPTRATGSGGAPVNVGGWLFWGFVGTIVLTTLMSGSQGMRLTRMNLPYMLGTMFTPSRDHAKLIGFGVHVMNGWLFSLLYVIAFQSWHRATWWLGAMIGLVHAAFVLTAGMRIVPGMHPRMAGEAQGPTVTRQLEPPGFLARNYGIRTPLSVVVAHVIYGAILGGFYHLG